MGLVEGNTNIFRSACPVRELAKSTSKDEKTKLAEAEASMRHLRKLGIRTIISFEDPYHYDADEKPNKTAAPASKGETKSAEKPSVTLERAAAEQAGIRYLSIPMRNSGENSIQDMTAGDIKKMLQSNSRAILDAAGKGGVLFHCSAGHDRTGMVAAYIRLKYQHWPAEEAIAEMRRYGHNWPKFSQDGGKSSWHEAKLREIAKSLEQEK
jgi:protein-tyrosine phosphatase